jgi:hypothetical protein
MHRRELTLITNTLREMRESIVMQEPTTDLSVVRLAAVEDTARNMARGFKLDNPSFREDLFLQSCGMKVSP